MGGQEAQSLLAQRWLFLVMACAVRAHICSPTGCSGLHGVFLGRIARTYVQKKAEERNCCAPQGNGQSSAALANSIQIIDNFPSIQSGCETLL